MVVVLRMLTDFFINVATVDVTVAVNVNRTSADALPVEIICFSDSRIHWI